MPAGLRTWILAARPRTLSAAVVPVLVGTALAVERNAFRALPAIAALVGAIAIQIGTNFANDYSDAVRGTDSERRGPTRVTQAGLVTERAMRAAIAIAFGVSVLCGVYLVGVGGWPILVLGILSIVSGLAYTGGPYPFGYHGLGEVFVLAFFGLGAVAGTYYVQAGHLILPAILLSAPVGLFSVAILVANNLRDIETDRRAGKMTLAARFGHRFGAAEYAAALLLAYLTPAALAIARALPAGSLLCLLSLPLAIPLLRIAHRADATLAEHLRLLAGTSRLFLVFGLLLGAGLLLDAGLLL